jgi:acyl-CoA synthetase (AMP-forming)/AMP-acid ligase II
VLNIAQTLHQVARRLPASRAISLGDGQFATYGEWAERVCALSAGLKSTYGLVKGDRVVIALTNRPDYLTLLYACWHAGLCAVPVNVKLHANEIAFIVKQCDAKLCIAETAIIDSWPEGSAGDGKTINRVSVPSNAFDGLFSEERIAVEDVDPTDPAWLFFTSGTTGKPKGAILTHRNLLAMSMSYFADYGSVDERDNVLHSAPLSHGAGLYALPFTMMGASHIIPASNKFDPAEVVELINYYGDITAFLAPTMITRLMDCSNFSNLNIENIRQFLYGGAPMYLEDIKRALRSLGPRLAQLYGQGECPMTISYLSCDQHMANGEIADEAVLMSAGIPRTGVDVRIAKEDGSFGAPGEEGEVIVKSDVVMAGYWGDPGATQHALKQGWLYTGDIGLLDEHGYLTLCGRSKEVIISGGSNIYPREVEDVLLQHPSVREAAVLGVPDPDWGEVIVAFVEVFQAGSEEGAVTIAELDEFCLDRIARFKRPKKIIFSAIPKNAAGKLDKIKLKNDYLQIEPEAVV